MQRSSRPHQTELTKEQAHRAADRLRRLGVPDEKTGCINWRGTTNSAGHGYMEFKRAGYQQWFRPVDEVAFEAARGRVPANHFLHRWCRNRACCNADHLEPIRGSKALRRVFEKLVSDANGCWLWSGALDRDGYGKTNSTRVHRVVWVALRGAIPAGLQIDHLCRVRHCANPAHLELVTPKENTRRGNAISQVLKRRTHCPQGHPRSPENTGMNGGKAYCRVCSRERSQRFREARRGRVA